MDNIIFSPKKKEKRETKNDMGGNYQEDLRFNNIFKTLIFNVKWCCIFYIADFT